MWKRLDNNPLSLWSVVWGNAFYCGTMKFSNVFSKLYKCVKPVFCQIMHVFMSSDSVNIKMSMKKLLCKLALV